MIQAVSEGQYDIGMTGITISDDRKPSRSTSPIPTCARRCSCWCAPTRTASPTRKSFAALDDELLVGAQAGTTPFYVAVYDVLDGNEANPRIKLFETFGASVAGADGRRRRPGADRRHRRQGLRRRPIPDALKLIGEPLGGRGLRLHLPQGLGPRGAGQRGDRRAEGRRHASTR